MHIFYSRPKQSKLLDHFSPPSISSVQSLIHVWLLANPWTTAHHTSLSITNPWSLLKLMSIELVMPSIQLIFSHPLLLPLSIFPSTRVFSNESVLRIRWPRYWSFNYSISLSNEYSGLEIKPANPKRHQRSSELAVNIGQYNWMAAPECHQFTGRDKGVGYQSSI